MLLLCFILSFLWTVTRADFCAFLYPPVFCFFLAFSVFVGKKIWSDLNVPDHHHCDVACMVVHTSTSRSCPTTLSAASEPWSGGHVVLCLSSIRPITFQRSPVNHRGLARHVADVTRTIYREHTALSASRQHVTSCYWSTAHTQSI